jgi:hypothetical protein
MGGFLPGVGFDTFQSSVLKEMGHDIPFLFRCMHAWTGFHIYLRDACPPVERNGTTGTVAIVLSSWHIHFSPVCSRSYETTLALALAWIAFIRFSTVY